MNKQTIISFSFGVVALTFAVGLTAYAAFTPPSTTPPGGNVDPPVNIGATLQHKAGVLQVDGLRSFLDGVFDGNIDVGGDIIVGGSTVINSSGSFLGEIEPRTSDPASPATGRIWLRTDL